MVIIMNDSELKSIEEVKRFLKRSKGVEFERKDKKQAYEWIENTLRRFGYLDLRKKEKVIVRSYIEKITGYSRSQVTRLIVKYRETGEVKVEEYERHKFEKKYTNQDIRLLAKTAELHDYPNGATLKRNLIRMAEKYQRDEYKRLSEISVSHIYNLTKTITYQRSVKVYQETKKSSQVGIGERRKPKPDGEPGYIRVDTVHQGDTSSGGGVYHINTVDEVVQWGGIGAVRNITKEHLIPLLREIIAGYPYKIKNFHADNGSEYINQYVAELTAVQNTPISTITSNKIIMLDT